MLALGVLVVLFTLAAAVLSRMPEIARLDPDQGFTLIKAHLVRAAIRALRADLV